MKKTIEIQEFLNNFEIQKKEFEEKNPGMTLIMHYETDPARNSVLAIKKDYSTEEYEFSMRILKEAVKNHDRSSAECA